MSYTNLHTFQSLHVEHGYLSPTYAKGNYQWKSPIKWSIVLMCYLIFKCITASTNDTPCIKAHFIFQEMKM